MRDRAGDRLAEKHNRGDIGGQKIHQTAAEMALEQAVAIEIGDLDRQELAPIIGWHDPVDRVLVAEEEAQRHAGGLRQMHEEKARPRWRPHRSTVHRLSSSRRVCAGCFRQFFLSALNRDWPVLWLPVRIYRQSGRWPNPEAVIRAAAARFPGLNSPYGRWP